MEEGQVVFTESTINKMAEEAARQAGITDSSEAKKLLDELQPEELIVRGVVAFLKEEKAM